MGKFAYKMAGIFGRAVSWEVGKAIRRKQRAACRQSVVNYLSAAPEPIRASKEEKEWIASINALARRVKTLNLERSKLAAREIYLLLGGAGSLHTQNQEFFSVTLHSQEFMAAYEKFADLTQQMADFSAAHLDQVEIDALVVETQGPVQVNADTWTLTIA